MTGGLSGKTCLVTGAGQGIGRAIVDRFCAEGASVIASDISEEHFGDFPCEAVAVKLDATDAKAVVAVVARHPRIDVLVNCAGYVAVGDILECDEADFARSLRINVESVYIMARAVLPGMRARRSGSIVNIASVVSTTAAARRRFVYAATKGAVIAMTRSIALDFIGDGVRCNSISPGTIDTPSLGGRIAAAADPAQMRVDMIARQPMGRLGRAEEVAAVAALLASDESAFMTGSDIVIDGGFAL
ncbi:MAG: SDR family oxidoreductase [Rudaea sp.]|uniref:SDR family oxidoreductase n=1 Tax=Rudaea sp. TaxID=2136325 RepID=UPI0039E6A634